MLPSALSVITKFRPEQCQQKLKPHELPGPKWAQTCLHLTERTTYVVTADYCSNFIEMDQLSESTSRKTIKVLKKWFSRHNIPDALISDNEPQYSLDEFRQFPHHWEFKHITSSPEQW